MFLHELLTEAATEKLFHITPIHKAAAIVIDRRFVLSPSVVKETELRFQPNNKYYYLSTSRSKIGDYITQKAKAGMPIWAVFNLNGHWFNERYKVNPVNFFSPPWKPFETQSDPDEMEDRVTSRDPVIPLPDNATDVISEIHFYLGTVQYDFVVRNRGHHVMNLIKGSKRLGIPLFFYDDASNFFMQNKGKSIPLREVLPRLKGAWKRKKPLVFEPEPHRDYYLQLRELYYKTDENELSPPAKKLLFMLRKSTLHTATQHIQEKLHEVYKEYRKSLDKLVRIMTKERLNTPGDLTKFLQDKWKDKPNETS